MTTVLLRRLFFITLLAAALCLSACQKPAPPTSNAEFPARVRSVGVRGGTITYRVLEPIKTFNYVMSTNEATNTVSFSLMGSRLVEFDHDKQTYVPALAETWPLSADGRTCEVTLRDGLKFSDGHALTADDVAFTLRALYDKRTASPLWGAATLVGGKEITAEVVDARHLRLVFPEQVATPENYLSNINVLPRAVLEGALKDGTFKGAYAINADPKTVVTAGPFMLDASQPGERVVLKRNPYYWKRDAAGNQLPYLDQIEVVVVADMNNAVAR